MKVIKRIFAGLVVCLLVLVAAFLSVAGKGGSFAQHRDRRAAEAPSFLT